MEKRIWPEIDMSMFALIYLILGTLSMFWAVGKIIECTRGVENVEGFDLNAVTFVFMLYAAIRVLVRLVLIFTLASGFLAAYCSLITISMEFFFLDVTHMFAAQAEQSRFRFTLAVLAAIVGFVIGVLMEKGINFDPKDENLIVHGLRFLTYSLLANIILSVGSFPDMHMFDRNMALKVSGGVFIIYLVYFIVRKYQKYRMEKKYFKWKCRSEFEKFKREWEEEEKEKQAESERAERERAERERANREQAEREYSRQRQNERRYQYQNSYSYSGKSSSHSTGGFFSGCKTDEEIKKLYWKLSKKYHPDNGGDDETFKKMKAEYESLVNRGTVL